MPKFDVDCQLTDSDGSTGAILATVARAIKQWGQDTGQIDEATAGVQQWRSGVFNCDSYDAVLRLAMETVNVN